MAVDTDERSMTIAEAVAAFDATAASIGAAQRAHLRWLAVCDNARVWAHEDCWDMAQWVALRDGISTWKARRIVRAAHALERLPAIAAALEDGSLSLDKVVELTRFATPADEQELVAWARAAAPVAIRERADRAVRRSLEEERADRWRELTWWWEDEGARMRLSGSLPADKGAVVATALDRLADKMPELPDERPPLDSDPESTLEARRADALVALASASIAADQDPDRATVVVHVELPSVDAEAPNGVIAGGPAIHPAVAEMMTCDSRLQLVAHGEERGVVGIGHTSRVIPRWLRRAVEHRDGFRCTFPGCGAKAFVDIHHVVPWPHGPTEIDNLMCACRFHHELLHVMGWHVTLTSGRVRWFRPDWTPYQPRPAP